jgi:NAD(P)-dependent dehydrogenase (short-subunit alcohol dehydrogenase family)
MSKAALNQATRNTAIELRRSNVIAVSLHPGTTDTELSRPFQRNVRPEKLFSAEKTAEMLLDVIDGLGMDDSGGFYDYAGKPIEW